MSGLRRRPSDGFNGSPPSVQTLRRGSLGISPQRLRFGVCALRLAVCPNDSVSLIGYAFSDFMRILIPTISWVSLVCECFVFSDLSILTSPPQRLSAPQDCRYISSATKPSPCPSATLPIALWECPDRPQAPVIPLCAGSLDFTPSQVCYPTTHTVIHPFV